jgi:hypothetical protein
MSARTLLATLIIAATATAATPPLTFWRASEGGWTPKRALIARLEARFVMPKGAGPLAAYHRAYAGSVEHGRRVVIGLLEKGGRPGVQIVSIHHLPQIDDGGCTFIDVEYDVAADRLEPLECHRMA